MYCKECGHCEKGVRDDCPICGRDIRSASVAIPGARKDGHWLFLILMLPLLAFYFVGLPFRAPQIHATEMVVIETLALPDLKKAGLVEFTVEGDKLLLEWDLRWGTLGDVRQREIINFLG